jgi:hypothetical protein
MDKKELNQLALSLEKGNIFRVDDKGNSMTIWIDAHVDEFGELFERYKKEYANIHLSSFITFAITEGYHPIIMQPTMVGYVAPRHYEDKPKNTKLFKCIDKVVDVDNGNIIKFKKGKGYEGVVSNDMTTFVSETGDRISFYDIEIDLFFEEIGEYKEVGEYNEE